MRRPRGSAVIAIALALISNLLAAVTQTMAPAHTSLWIRGRTR